MSTQDILKTLKSTVDVDTSGLVDSDLLDHVAYIIRMEHKNLDYPSSELLLRKLIQLAINRWIRKFFVRTDKSVPTEDEQTPFLVSGKDGTFLVDK
jgi:hypothetical protein